MALYFEVIEGTNVGFRYKVRKNDRIGRSGCEINLLDSKVSSFHAEVITDSKNQLLLADRNSTNGLLIAGEKVKKIALLPGVKFQVGRTFFKVVELFAQEGDEQIEPELEPKSWRDFLAKLVPELLGQNKTVSPQCAALAPAIQLLFLEGIHADTSMVLGYGPRQVGLSSLDIEIKERFSPPIAFEIKPDIYGAKFETSAPSVVLLNNQPIKSDYLKSGDQIKIGDTLIEVKFLHG